MLRKVKVNLYDRFILDYGNPFQFLVGTYHPYDDTIFIVQPISLKHELLMVLLRDSGKEFLSKYREDPNCDKPFCFGQSGRKMQPNTRLCDFHQKLVDMYLGGKFSVDLDVSIFFPTKKVLWFYNEKKAETDLKRAMYYFADEFSKQTEIPTKISKIKRDKRRIWDGSWLLLFDHGYAIRYYGSFKYPPDDITPKPKSLFRLFSIYPWENLEEFNKHRR
jgi:hypothetical protein